MSENTGDRIFAIMSAISDEEKEICIHCGKEWYKIHHKDGVCNCCQKLGRPGREKMAIAKSNFITFVFLAVAIVVLFFTFYNLRL